MSVAVQRGRSAMYVVPVCGRIEDIPDFVAYPTLTSELGIEPVRDWPLEMRTGYSHVVMSFREDGQDMHVVLSGGSLGATAFYPVVRPSRCSVGLRPSRTTYPQMNHLVKARASEPLRWGELWGCAIRSFRAGA